MASTRYEGGIFMNSEVIANIPKNKMEEIRISLLKNNKIDVRSCFHFPNENEPKPTRKGVLLSFKHLPEIIKEFEKLSAKPDEEINLEFEQTDKVKLRVYTSDYRGKKIIHIRTFYLKDDEFLPGKGVSFSPELITSITDGLKKVAARGKE